MNDTALSVAFLLLIVALCIVILYMFNKRIKGNSLDGKAKANQNEENKYRAGNVLELIGWLNKNPDELKIENFTKPEGSFIKVDFDGKLLNSDAYGSVYFSNSDGGVVVKADSIFIQTKELTFEECRNRLTEFYGKPENEHEEPFTQVKGGAVQRCTFKVDGIELLVEKASEKDYVIVTIK